MGFLFFVYLAFVICEFGIDVSTLLSQKDWECLVNEGYTFADVRCYRSIGKVDENCPQTIKNAWAAGMKVVDAYIFPAPKMGGGENQVVRFLKENNVTYGTLWLDIEGTEYWGRDKQANRQFFEELLLGVEKQGVKTGIYSSLYMWDELFGLDYTKGGEYPLWYAHYDNDPTFKDFKPFAGWTEPFCKQFAGDVIDCECDVDKNWKPDPLVWR